ncbi:stage VI sporulation protein F [Metabacillus sp. HB246100]|uniref:stage VI sporulation protein F n=1 Tax=Bacillus weihaiensis TaxID=1547283 RepID=UPI0023562DFE|nr:stage VI sporulation protein F [Bacillus weihaiensis]
MLNPKMLRKMEKKTGLDISEIMQVTQSINKSKIQDEDGVRRIVNKLSKVSPKPIDQEMEEMIVHTVLNNKVPKGLVKFLDNMNISR